jgi:Na+/H+ antiporter NhaC
MHPIEFASAIWASLTGRRALPPIFILILHFVFIYLDLYLHTLKLASTIGPRWSKYRCSVVLLAGVIQKLNFNTTIRLPKVAVNKSIIN